MGYQYLVKTIGTLISLQKSFFQTSTNIFKKHNLLYNFLLLFKQIEGNVISSIQTNIFCMVVWPITYLAFWRPKPRFFCPSFLHTTNK